MNCLYAILASYFAAFPFYGQENRPISVTNRDPEFQLTIPPGYTKSGNSTSVIPYSFMRVYGEEQSYKIVVAIGIYPGTFSPSEADGEQLRNIVTGSLSPGFQARTIREIWNQRSIPVVEIRHSMNNMDMYCLNAIIPLVPKAVEINVTGYKGQETEVYSELKRILGTFRGKTHWLTPSQRIMAWATGVPSLLAITMFVIYGFTHLIYYRKRPNAAYYTRLIWLSGIVILLVFSGIIGIFYEMSKGSGNIQNIGMKNAVQVLIIIGSIIMVDNLYKRRKVARIQGNSG